MYVVCIPFAYSENAPSFRCMHTLPDERILLE